MIVKVFIKREIKEGKSKEVLTLIKKFRSNAMDQSGHISGETLFNYDDPQKMVVVSMWQSIENWLQWKENKDRQVHEDKMSQYLEKPTEYEVYVLGAYSHKK